MEREINQIEPPQFCRVQIEQVRPLRQHCNVLNNAFNFLYSLIIFLLLQKVTDN